jgi:hypothetical protein
MCRVCNTVLIDSRPATQLEPRYLLLVLLLAMAVNTYRLHGKRKRGQQASYDGQRSPVAGFDVLLSAGLSLVLLAACLYEWLVGK